MPDAHTTPDDPATAGERPIPDSYWVVPGRLLAGEYPGARNKADARAKLQRLLAAGVTCFIDLTEAGEGLQPYANLLAEEAQAAGQRAEHRRMPIPDLGVPTKQGMIEILDEIDRRLRGGDVVYVHCWGGVGRTGTVVGCYLRRHRLAGDPIAEIARLRAGTPKDVREAPETDAQRDMIRHWAPDACARPARDPETFKND